MTCGFIRRHLGTFLDGELDPTTQIELERHIQGCARCQEQLEFERAYRDHFRQAVGGVRAPAGLEARVLAALDAAPASEAPGAAPMLRFVHLGPRRAIPLAAAAAVVMVVLGSVGVPGSSNQASLSSTVPLFEDVVRVHQSDLPADVASPDRVAPYFQNKLSFPVHPARFDRVHARLVGARLASVRGGRAAVLYYDVLGRRLTVVVCAGTQGPPATRRLRFDGHEVYYHRIDGYFVPVRRYDGLNYAFTGDFDQETLMRLAASARIGD
ncbi:MAG: zf-HC2 domain-containing protein [Myxococcales bacterium]|nr:zf-HC2 domain-containing protein [Myxococcales bacterium]